MSGGCTITSAWPVWDASAANQWLPSQVRLAMRGFLLVLLRIDVALPQEIREMLLRHIASADGWALPLSQVVGLCVKNISEDSGMYGNSGIPLVYPINAAACPFNRVLLYGPPGCGKTYAAFQLDECCDVPIKSISCYDFFTSYHEAAARGLADAFVMEDASPDARRIIVLDDIHVLTSDQGKDNNGLTAFIEALDLLRTADHRIIVIAITTRPQLIREAMLHEFPLRIYCGIANLLERRICIQELLHSIPLSDAERLTQSALLQRFTQGYSHADFQMLEREVMMIPVRICQEATHWKQLSNGKFTPCEAGEPDAVEISLWDVYGLGEGLEPPALDLVSVIQSIQSTTASVSPLQVALHKEWKAYFGHFKF